MSTFNKKRVGRDSFKALVFVVSSMMVLAGFLGCSLVSAAPVISVDPSFMRVWGLDETFNVNLTISSVTNLYACEINVFYDPLQLNGTNITEGPFLKSQGLTFFIRDFNDNYNATHGRARIADSILGNVSGVSGSGVAATIAFQSKQLGTYNLALEGTKLADPRNIPISHTTSSGSVEVVPVVRDVAVKNVNASVTEACAGQIVNIYVVVTNEGNKTETFEVTAYANDVAVDTKTVSHLAIGGIATVTLSWNTTDLALGDYTIKTEAQVLLGETDLGDNVLADGTVKIVPKLHDVAVNSVIVPVSEVHGGQIVNIQVVVANNGNYTETFDASLCYGQTVISSQVRSLLVSGGKETLSFAWNTTGFPVGTSYPIKAVVGAVQGEINLADNTFTDGTVRILPPLVPVDLSVETDKLSYKVGETINVYGSLVSDAPVPNSNVALEIRDPKASPIILRTAQTNSSGQYLINFTLSGEAVPETYTVNATCNYQGTIASDTTHFKLTSASVLLIRVATDQPSYKAGDLVTISGNVTVDGLPPQQTGVALEVDDPEYNPIATRTLQTDQNGNFQLSLATSDAFKTGNYSVHVGVSYQGLTATSSTIFELKTTKRQADVNGDGKVNILDLTLVALAFGSHPGEPRWDPRCDLDGNNAINILDITLVARAWTF